jgi:hypothetical protein
MPDILIKCPITGKPAPTGLRTETIVLASIPVDLMLELRCPSCLKMHEWRRKDAWVDGGSEKGPMPDFKRGH